MSNKNTIESINSYWDSLIDTGLISCSELCDCINALEKQIPSKVIVKDTEDIFNSVCDGYFCPACEKEVLYGYCENCGQKIDWSQCT